MPTGVPSRYCRISRAECRRPSASLHALCVRSLRAFQAAATGKGVPTYLDFQNGSSARRLLSGLQVPRDCQAFQE